MFLPPKMLCAGLTAGKDRQYGDMVKLAATLDSNSSVERRIGSNPIIPTMKISYSSSFGDWPYIGDRKDVIPVKDVKPDKKRNKV